MTPHVPGPPNFVSKVRGPGVESSVNLSMNSNFVFFQRPLDDRDKVQYV